MHDRQFASRPTGPALCALAVMLAILATACGARDQTTDRAEDTDMTIAPGLQRLVALAVEDLSRRTDVPSSEIAVVTAEAVTWPDASLGCPQPDMRYAQVPQDGARIHLTVGDRMYRYHAGGRRVQPFLCEPGITQKRPTRLLDPRLTERPDT